MSERNQRFFISAGEASGDLHGADLVAELRRQSPGAEITFLGGDLMARETGRPPLVHYSEMAYMGFAEVLRHLPSIARILRQAKEFGCVRSCLCLDWFARVSGSRRPEGCLRR